MQEYNKLLEKAIRELPKEVKVVARYEIPRVTGHVEGNKTIVTNFNQICDSFNREPQHLLKYLQRELATPGTIEGNRLILGRKLRSSLINSKIQDYADIYVLCYDCKKPDTKLIQEGNFLYIKCTACGAKYHVKTKI